MENTALMPTKATATDIFPEIRDAINGESMSLVETHASFVTHAVRERTHQDRIQNHESMRKFYKEELHAVPGCQGGQ